jgi:hypothetical protein
MRELGDTYDIAVLIKDWIEGEVIVPFLSLYFRLKDLSMTISSKDSSYDAFPALPCVLR